MTSLSLVNTRGFCKRLLTVLTLSTIFYACHSLRFVYSEIMGRVTLCLEQHLMDMFPEPSPNKNSLRKESLNLGMCAQLWVVAWLTVLPLICDPFLGAVTKSITITSDPHENCAKEILLVHQLGNALEHETNMYPQITQERRALFPFVRCPSIWKYLNQNEKYMEYF